MAGGPGAGAVPDGPRRPSVCGEHRAGQAVFLAARVRRRDGIGEILAYVCACVSCACGWWALYCTIFCRQPTAFGGVCV